MIKMKYKFVLAIIAAPLFVAGCAVGPASQLSGSSSKVEKAVRFADKYCAMLNSSMSNMRQVLTKEGFKMGGAGLRQSFPSSLVMSNVNYPGMLIARSGSSNGNTQCKVVYRGAPKSVPALYDITVNFDFLEHKPRNMRGMDHRYGSYSATSKVTGQGLIFKIPSNGEITINK